MPASSWRLRPAREASSDAAEPRHCPSCGSGLAAGVIPSSPVAEEEPTGTALEKETATPQPARRQLAAAVSMGRRAARGRAPRPPAGRRDTRRLMHTPRPGLHARCGGDARGLYASAITMGARCGPAPARTSTRRPAARAAGRRPNCHAPGGVAAPSPAARRRRISGAPSATLLQGSAGGVAWGRVRPGPVPSTIQGHPSCRSRRMPIDGTTSRGSGTG